MSRFDELAEKLGHRKGVTNPKALAAYIGDKKYGKKKMHEMAAEAQRRGLDKMAE